jgi:hypothetical protein
MQRTGESGHDFLVDHLTRLPLITTLEPSREAALKNSSLLRSLVSWRGTATRSTSLVAICTLPLKASVISFDQTLRQRRSANRSRAAGSNAMGAPVVRR